MKDIEVPPSDFTQHRGTFVENVTVQCDRKEDRRTRKIKILCRNYNRTFALKDQLV